MTPIISPWWFYLIDVLGNLKLLCNPLLLIVIGICVVALLSTKWSLKEDILKLDEDKSDAGLYKDAKILCVTLLVLFVVGNFIPSKETMYTMMVAQNVTYENVEKAADIIQDSVDYIFDKFNGGEE